MALIDELIERDGASCVWCGASPWREDLTLEHLCPRSKGGRTSLENLLVACHGCNQKRRSKSAVSYLRRCLVEGKGARTELIAASLGALSRSASRKHREYGAGQLRHLASVEG